MVIKIIGGVATLICAGGAVACAIPESREWLLDKVAPYSNAYKLKDEEVKNLTLENQVKQNTIDLLTQELANKNVELEEKKQRIVELEELLNTANEDNSVLREEKATLQARVSELESQVLELQNQLNVLAGSGISLEFSYNECNFTYMEGEYANQYNIPDKSLVENGELWTDFGIIDYLSVPIWVKNLSNLTVFQLGSIDRYKVQIDGNMYTQNVRNSNVSYNSADYSFNFNYLIDDVVYNESNIVAGVNYVPSCDFTVNEDTKTIDFTINFISEYLFNSTECTVDFTSLINEFANNGELPAEYDIYVYSWGGETLSPEFLLVSESGLFLVGNGSTGCKFIVVEKETVPSWENAKMVSSDYIIENQIAVSSVII